MTCPSCKRDRPLVSLQGDTVVCADCGRSLDLTAIAPPVRPAGPETDSLAPLPTTGDLDALAKLRVKFPAEAVGLLPKPTKRDNPKGDCSVCGGWHGLPAIHVDYVGHATVTDRYLSADPEWNWEPLALDEDGLPLLDKNGGLWIKLTIAGVTRLGYGDGPDPKQLIGDALRNAGMRFGVALDLWTKDELESQIGEESGKAKRTRAPKSSTPISQETGGRVTRDPETAGKTGISATDRNTIIRTLSQQTPPVVGPAVAEKVGKILGMEGPAQMAKLTVAEGETVFKALEIPLPQEKS